MPRPTASLDCWRSISVSLDPASARLILRPSTSAEPVVVFGFGDAVSVVGDDVAESLFLGRVGLQERASDAGVFEVAVGAVGAPAGAETDAAGDEVGFEFFPFGRGGEPRRARRARTRRALRVQLAPRAHVGAADSASRLPTTQQTASSPSTCSDASVNHVDQTVRRRPPTARPAPACKEQAGASKDSTRAWTSSSRDATAVLSSSTSERGGRRSSGLDGCDGLANSLVETCVVSSIADPVLAAELERRRGLDQTLRVGPGADTAGAHAVDANNRKWLAGVIAQQGWPGRSLVGDRGANTAWLIAQHADDDPEFQRSCLSLLRRAREEGEAAAADLAYLEDRVRTAAGEPQVYGTQGRPDDEGCWRPSPIEDADRVDERRRVVGLESLDDYQRRVQAFVDMDRRRPRERDTQRTGLDLRQPSDP